MVLRIVRCLSGTSRAHPAESARSNLESSASGSRNLVLAAANSKASGSPESRQQIAATAEAFSSVISNAGEVALARSAKRYPEDDSETSWAAGETVEAGRAKGPTGDSCSPLTRYGA